MHVVKDHSDLKQAVALNDESIALIQDALNGLDAAPEHFRRPDEWVKHVAKTYPMVGSPAVEELWADVPRLRAHLDLLSHFFAEQDRKAMVILINTVLDINKFDPAPPPVDSGWSEVLALFLYTIPPNWQALVEAGPDVIPGTTAEWNWMTPAPVLFRQGPHVIVRGINTAVDDPFIPWMIWEQVDSDKCPALHRLAQSSAEIAAEVQAAGYTFMYMNRVND